MAVEIIQPPREHNATCSGCGAVLKYLGTDITDLPAGSSRVFRRTVKGIKCPACGKNVPHVHYPPVPTIPPAPPRPPSK